MSDPAINVDGLVKLFTRRGQPPVRAVDGLCFRVEPGVIFGLLGPNGAGKTTTLRILTTLTTPTAGVAQVAGYDVVAAPLEVRRRIAVVIQASAAELLLSTRENLLTFARFHGLSGQELRRRADRVLEQLGLTEEANRKVQDLSGGFRRRVQVAKIFMVDTPVVFLDEFSTGMDPILKRSLMHALQEEAHRGRTIVLTTHILSEAEELCDDILIMNRGRQVARGDLTSLKLLSQGVYEVTIAFDELPAGIDSALAALRPLRSSVNGHTIEIALKEEESRVLDLAAGLARLGHVRHVDLSGASLEDVFIELMEES
ncbi:MAG: ATP-binding cassette domain-containing protein [Luteitalea sp.]|nr:ATP-binding cassette domain-containing protein [Luteitalea sp.]